LYAWREAYKQACPDQEYLDALEQGRMDFIGNLGIVKNSVELHDLAFQIKAKLLKNEFITDGEAEKYEQFCSEINRLGKEKMDQMRNEPKKNLAEFFQKNKKAGYLLLSGGGLLAASVFMGHSHTHLLNNSIVHLGIQSLRALASVSCVFGISSAVGFFSRFKKTEEKALPKPNIEIDENVQILALDKLRTASVAALDLCRQQWPAGNNPGFDYANKLVQYGSPLALSRSNPASFVMALIKIIEHDREKNQLGLILEESIKDTFFIPDANSGELITELKEFNKICIPIEINKVSQSLNLIINAPGFLKEIVAYLNNGAHSPEAHRFAEELLGAGNFLEKIKLQVNVGGKLGECLVNILNIVCETGADPLIWRQVLDKISPAAQPCLKSGLR